MEAAGPFVKYCCGDAGLARVGQDRAPGAYASGDCEIALALAAPQVRWDERASRPDSDLVWGHDKVQRAMRRYLDGWEEYRFELEDVAEVGPGKVVGICRERGKPEDGTAVDRRFGGLWIVEEGKITAWATYPTPGRRSEPPRRCRAAASSRSRSSGCRPGGGEAAPRTHFGPRAEGARTESSRRSLSDPGRGR